MGARRIFSRGGQIHTRSEDFFLRCTFFPKKVEDFFVFFLVVALKAQAKTTEWTTEPLWPSKKLWK